MSTLLVKSRVSLPSSSISDNDAIPRSPIATGTLLALLAARFGRGVGPFTTAALLYAGAATLATLVRRRKESEAPLRHAHLPRLVGVALVGVHDFPSDAVGKAAPCGVYDLDRNEGWVSVGVDHDTAEFAVESIRRWWRMMGQKAYPTTKEWVSTSRAS